MKIFLKHTGWRYYIQLLIIASSFAFIAISIYLVNEVVGIQEKVRYKVNCISTVDEIQQNGIHILQDILDSNQISQDQRNELERLAGSNPELYLINEVITAATYLQKVQLSSYELILLKQDLYSIERLSEHLRSKFRTELREYSTDLANYWQYTHYILLIACVLMIILVLTIFYASKTHKLLSEALSKNEVLFNNAINCIISCDRNGNILEFNEVAEDSFGYSRKEALRLNLADLYSKVDELKDVTISLADHDQYSGEVINKRKDGRLFISYLSANNIYDDEKNLVGSIGISRDITKEKQQQREIHSIIDNAQDVIYTADINGNFTFVNEYSSEVMGYEMDELIGKNFTALVSESQLAEVQQFYQKQFDNKTPNSYLEFVGRRKDASEVWLGQNVTTLFSLTSPGKIIGFQGVVRDISERKEAEEKLRKSEENFQIIANTIEDMFYLYNFETNKFDYVSPNTTEVFGVGTDFFYSGESYFDNFIHPDDIDRVKRAEKELLNGETYQLEYRIILKNQAHWIQDRAYPIKDKNNKVISYSGIIRDITDFKHVDLRNKQQNEEILRGLAYAKNIQESTLINLEDAKNFYEKSFILFQARDTISGDFYIMEEFKSKTFGPLKVFAVADCTGHGIPGGMLSFLCSSLVSEALVEPSINNTAAVLEFVRNKLIKLFRSEEEAYMTDGMDIALCAINEEKDTLYFSGANIPLILIRNKLVIELEGDKQQVGYNRSKMEFTERSLSLQEGDAIYLMSDGYQDQIGGPRKKKFMKTRVRDMLAKLSIKPIDEQHQDLELAFQLWKGNNKQVDDVTIMGIIV